MYYLESEGQVALNQIEEMASATGLKLQLDAKLKAIADGEFNTYGKVDLRIRLYRTEFHKLSDFLVEVRTAKTNGRLTNPAMKYHITLTRNPQGDIIGIRT